MKVIAILTVLWVAGWTTGCDSLPAADHSADHWTHMRDCAEQVDKLRREYQGVVMTPHYNPRYERCYVEMDYPSLGYSHLEDAFDDKVLARMDNFDDRTDCFISETGESDCRKVRAYWNDRMELKGRDRL